MTTESIGEALMAKDCEGRIPFHVACRYSGKVDILRLLLEQQHKFNRLRYTSSILLEPRLVSNTVMTPRGDQSQGDENGDRSAGGAGQFRKDAAHPRMRPVTSGDGAVPAGGWRTTDPIVRGHDLFSLLSVPPSLTHVVCFGSWHALSDSGKVSSLRHAIDHDGAPIVALLLDRVRTPRCRFYFSLVHV